MVTNIDTDGTVCVITNHPGTDELSDRVKESEKEQKAFVKLNGDYNSTAEIGKAHEEQTGIMWGYHPHLGHYMVTDFQGNPKTLPDTPHLQEQREKFQAYLEEKTGKPVTFVYKQ